MAKFCGKCGSKLDEATGICPNCSSDKLNKQISKSELVEKSEPRQNATPESEKPLSQKEEKKKRKVDKKAEKKEKRAQWSKGRKVRRFFLKFMLAILCLTVLAGLTGVLVYFDVVHIPIISDFKQEHLLEFVNEKNIIIEEKNTVMTSETEGEATLIVTIPDYEQLFKEASAAKKPEQYLLNALILKNYNTMEFEISAKVTVENGKRIIDSDEEVHQLLEENLINAINALSEVKA